MRRIRGYDVAALKTRKRVGLDFDDTLHSNPEYTGPRPTGRPIKGARDFVLWLRQHGYEPFIFSTRALDFTGRVGIREWLAQHKFPLLEVTFEKLPALFYLDDRAVRFNGPHTFWTLMQTLQGEPEVPTWEHRKEAAEG
jgi:hypothetical protein